MWTCSPLGTGYNPCAGESAGALHPIGTFFHRCAPPRGRWFAIVKQRGEACRVSVLGSYRTGPFSSTRQRP
jgi:hypothetical protein